MADKRGNIMLRFGIVYVLVVLAFVAIIAKTLYIQTVEKKPLLELSKKTQSTNDTSQIDYKRGNIFACDGRLLSSSIPTYIIRMDTRAGGLNIIEKKRGKNGKYKFELNGKPVTPFQAKLDSLAGALATYFDDKTKPKQYYKSMISRAHAAGARDLKLYPYKISYVQLQDIKKMPLFRYGENTSGLTPEEFIEREKPFGSLASQTLGSIYTADQIETDKQTGEKKITAIKGSGKNGLEKFFDLELTGKKGIARRQKVAQKSTKTTIVAPIAGNDIYTTIDVDIQDLAESALREKLNSIKNADSACVIVMTTDGEIKACVNLCKNGNDFSEISDVAVRNRCDIGSTFKTVSMMIALENGYIKPDELIVSNKSPARYHVTDIHPFPALLMPAEIIMKSCNIGISNIIINNYENKPQQFIDDVRKTGFLDSMNIQIADPKTPNLAKITAFNISRMSFGHSIEVSPLYTLRFYNAIANGGEMVQPRFVSAIKSEGKTVKVFDKEVINKKICSDSTLKIIKSMLERVVNDEKGTGNKAVKSDSVKIAGKTGTAEITKTGKNFVSFCGYFPADNPKYTCIVAMLAPGGNYGADASGSVFKKIAEGITTMRLRTTPEVFAANNNFNLLNIKKMPYIKNGNFLQLKTVAKELKFPLTGDGQDWITAKTDSNSIATKPISFSENLVPNVYGMGAKDAVYLLERAGLSVKIIGRGKVVEQSIPPGTTITPGKPIILTLEFFP